MALAALETLAPQDPLYLPLGEHVKDATQARKTHAIKAFFSIGKRQDLSRIAVEATGNARALKPRP
jgi:hypothetical protein